MTAEDVGREGLRLASRLADAAVAIPVAAVYVALGAAVLVGRTLLDVGSRTQGLVVALGREQRDDQPRKPRAA